LIDEAGTPTHCLIQRSYSDEAFNRAVCEKIIARARFEPAVDAQGNPVSAYFADQVAWVIGR